MSSKSKRAILWLGGSGLPSGTTGEKLSGLGYPVHWDSLCSGAARTVKSLEPILVVIDRERISGEVRQLLRSLSELKSSIDMVVFHLRRREPRAPSQGVDGTLLRGAGLVRQIRTVLDTMEGGRTFKASGRRAQKRLEKVKAELEHQRTLAVRDDLTCLYNLRFFNRSLETEHQRATRFGRSYSLVFLDLDGLREVNSRHGHLAGADVLRRVGELLISRIRRIDVAARIGGDEFVVICPETSKESARYVAERIRAGIQDLRGPAGNALGITASLGVSSFPDDADVPEDVLRRADRALYEAKALGKNRVVAWGEFADDEKSFLGSVHGASPEADLSANSKKKRLVN